MRAEASRQPRSGLLLPDHRGRFAPSERRSIKTRSRTIPSSWASPMDRPDLDHLFSATYEELRRLARSVRSDHPAASLSPTTIVNEAYLKLASSLRIEPESRTHFKRLAARAMRQVLVEAARRRGANRRGGDWHRITFDAALQVETASFEEILLLDMALEELARLSPRQAAMMECRFFGGLSTAETAEALGVSEATLNRDWRAARAWLSVELARRR